MKAASGKFLQNIVLEHEQRDAGLSMLRSTSGVLEDIRAVLGLPVVRNTQSGYNHSPNVQSQGKIEECEAWLAQVRAASEKPFRSKYFRDVTT